MKFDLFIESNIYPVLASNPVFFIDYPSLGSIEVSVIKLQDYKFFGSR